MQNGNNNQPLMDVPADRVPGVQRRPHRRVREGEEVVAPALDRRNIPPSLGLPWRRLPFDLVL